MIALDDEEVLYVQEQLKKLNTERKANRVFYKNQLKKIVKV